MRSRGTPIGTSVVIGIATGILMKCKKTTPAGSSYQLTKEWAKVFCAVWDLLRGGLIVHARSIL